MPKMFCFGLKITGSWHSKHRPANLRRLFTTCCIIWRSSETYCHVQGPCTPSHLYVPATPRKVASSRVAFLGPVKLTFSYGKAPFRGSWHSVRPGSALGLLWPKTWISSDLKSLRFVAHRKKVAKSSADPKRATVNNVVYTTQWPQPSSLLIKILYDSYITLPQGVVPLAQMGIPPFLAWIVYPVPAVKPQTKCSKVPKEFV